MSENKQYQVPNRAVPKTIVASGPINLNWNTIEEALNNNYELAKDIVNKVDNNEKGIENGIATLNEYGKLSSAQVPEQVKGHVYTVDDIGQRDAIAAYQGDICYVLETSRTYYYYPDPENIRTDAWVEIATKNGGGTVIGNTCYTTQLDTLDWLEDRINNNYYIEFTNIQHGQGSTKYLLVNIKREDGRVTECDYYVDDSGTVKITSDLPFEARVMISNLSGNVKNSTYIPYCIMSGNTDSGNPSLFIISGNNITLDVSKPISLVDGYGICRNIIQLSENAIKNLNPTNVSDKPQPTTSLPPRNIRYIQEGIYVVCIDSEDIIKDNSSQYNGILTDIKFTEKENYIGVVDELPSTGVHGQRCFVKYDKSYEYRNDNWVPKPFTPVGEIIVESNNQVYINGVTTYPYKQNNFNVNSDSTCFDYLLGNEITGLNISINDNISVSTGSCLMSTKIGKLSSDLTREFYAWGRDMMIGYPETNIGCIDRTSFEVNSTIYEVTEAGDENNIYYTDVYGEDGGYVISQINVYEDVDLSQIHGISTGSNYMYNGNTIASPTLLNHGWGYIYLINRKNYFDLLLSFSEVPNLPTGFTEYRRIGYFYREQSDYFNLMQTADSYITKQIMINKVNYLNEPISLELVEEDDKQFIDSNLPEDLTMILNIKSDNIQDIEIYFNGILLHSAYTKNITIEVPQNVNVVGNNLNIKLLGYRDERK